MRTTLFLAFALMTTTIASKAQSPGDRPAPNPRATRSVVMARNGIIATSQPLASAAGLAVLQNGGNAIDAAVTAAAVLSVVEPTMNGVGGDLFALVYDPKTKTVRALNASGRAPAAATLEEFKRRNLDVDPVSRRAVGQRAGRRGRLERAAREARHDRRSTQALAAGDPLRAGRLRGQRDHRLPVEGPGGDAGARSGGGRDVPARRHARRAPATSSATRSSRASLELIAKGGRDAFYKGPIAKAIADDMQRRKGLLTAADLAAHTSDWTEPISTTYQGHQVLEFPPNTQGVVALEMLNILEGFDLKALGHNSAAYLHLLVEAKKIAFADRDAWLADPEPTPPEALRADAVEGLRRRAPQGDRSRARRARVQAAVDRRALAPPARSIRRRTATRSTSPPPTRTATSSR